MKKNEKIIFIIGGIIFVSVLTILILTRNPDRTTWFKATGEVISIFDIKPTSRTIRFYLNGIEYKSSVGLGLSGSCIGDVYEILVNPNDKDIYLLDGYRETYLLDERPLFLNDELVGETIGIIDEDYKSDFTKEYQGAYPKFMNYDSGYNEIFPEYNYKVNDKEYSRIQDIVTPLDSPLVLKKGMKFRFRYWLDDLKRSILDYNEKR